jgi:crossover junction endodeoxyribonuclease RuvC
MIILGVDPGTLVTGYGIIESKNGTVRVLACDAIRNTSATSMPFRLKRIYDALCETIARYHPDELAIETAFYGKNAQSALKLGHARGVALLAAVSREIPTSEYSPREVKKAVAGKGNANKEQVQYMVKSLVCHLHRAAPRRGGAYRSWKAFLAAHPERLSPGTKKR